MAILLGVEEAIRCIVETSIVGPSDEELCVAYKTSIRVVGGGVFLRDEGYVLAVVPDQGDEASTYFHMTEADIAEYQEQAVLPNPLPEYQIPLGDYLYGYSAWLFLALAVGWGIYSTRHLSEKEANQASDFGSDC